MALAARLHRGALADRKAGVAVRSADAAAAAHRSASSLAATASVEASPAQLAAAGDLTALLPAATEVYLPAPSGSDWAQTLAACDRLRRQGMTPVPHLAARTLASAADLDARLASLVDASVSALLLIAGDAPRPAGPFADSLEVLDTDKLARRGIRDLRVAVHPEGHPVASGPQLSRALAAKIAYARRTGTRLLLVSQFAFSTARVLAWWQALALAPETPPLRVGLPGPCGLRRLLAYAARCGVGASARALARRPALARLAGGWSPSAMLEDLAGPGAVCAAPVSGVHVFCFGGLPATAQWLRERVASGGPGRAGCGAA